MYIALLGCTKAKSTARCTALEMYAVSPLFRLRHSYTLLYGGFERWSTFVVSAKYGLLALGKTIDPYDLALDGVSAHERSQWAEKVAKELRNIFPHSTWRNAFIFAGGLYRKNLIPALEQRGFRGHAPLQSLKIGAQMQWLRKQIALWQKDTLPTGFKVLRPDLTSIGLLGAKPIVYGHLGSWTLPHEPLSDGLRDGGGLWVVPTAGAARHLARYVERRHKVHPRIFRCEIGTVLRVTSCRIKTDKVRLLEEIATR